MGGGACNLGNEGRTWFRKALLEHALSQLDAICGDLNSGRRIGNSTDVLAAIEPVDELARSVLPAVRPVRIVAFNKTQTANWVLPWHQDRTIAARDRIETPGFANWTRKAGVWHVEPPIEMLTRMIFLRVHLDPADETTGALELALGSHHGFVAADRADAVASDCPKEHCRAQRGDVLAAGALILHRSGASQRLEGRRAIRIDYSADVLPSPLQWEFDA